MLDDAPSFTPTKRSKVKRNHLRGAYDQETVFAILDSAPLCHIGYVIDGQSYVTPTLVWRDGDRLYWHGSSASRMLRTVREAVPVCVTAAHFDGWVLARSAFHHSANYRSVMAFGRAEQVQDAEEKEAALKLMMEQIWPGRWDALRPMTAQELKATMVGSMRIEEASAKIRNGPPVDDDDDYALDIWAGVLPIETGLADPVPDPKLREGVAQPAGVTQPNRGPR
ncbi:MAG: pyridoxamine 5'-phosphate oxidase family protein [Alphaproteobacteria bacterium]|nr:pyridoxamine 5'-phosphate oxidase family protein [Alphaproteobacteria bacterium]